jgi:hypothetical protein
MEVIYKNSLVEKILPFLRRQSKMSYIGVAVLCLFVERAYSILRVPKNLRHFPSVGYLTMLKSILYNESLDDRTNRLIRPLVESGAKAYVVNIIVFISFKLMIPATI